MTPQQQAKELIDNYRDVRWDICPETAKQCALVAVNQTINSIKLIDPNNDSGLIGFWNNVKLYIETL